MTKSKSTRYNYFSIMMYKMNLESLHSFYRKISKMIDEEDLKIRNDYDNGILADFYNDYDKITFEELVGNMSYENEMMEYTSICMLLGMLYGMWEQQIIEFAISRGKTISKSKARKGLKKVVKSYSTLGTDLYCIIGYDKITELGLLVNVIKHGKGTSESILRDMQPRYFANVLKEEKETQDYGYAKNIEHLKNYELPSLYNELTVSYDDFLMYYNVMIEFWNQFDKVFTNIEKNKV